MSTQNSPSRGPSEVTTNLQAASRSLEAGLVQTRGVAKKAAEDLLGKPLAIDQIAQDENSTLDTVARLAEVWAESFDKLSGYIGLLFGRPVSKHLIDSAVHTPAVDAHREEGWETTDPITIAPVDNAKIEKRAKHAADALNNRPEARKFLARASARWNIPQATLASFVEIESAWNADSTPTYVDINTGRKVHAKDENGNEIKRILTRHEQAERGLKLTSSAHGYAQVMSYDMKKYFDERYDQFNSERPAGSSALPPKTDPLAFYNDELAMDFMGWHLNNKRQEVDAMIRAGKCPEKYRIGTGPEDTKWHYLSYNSGAKGYVLIRTYMDNPTPENYANLTFFQKREFIKSDGTNTHQLEGLVRVGVAAKAAKLAQALESGFNKPSNVA